MHTDRFWPVGQYSINDIIAISINPGCGSFQSFSGGISGKEPNYQYRRHKRCRFDPWVGKIPQELLLFSHSVISYSLWPYGMQPARLPGPSLSPRTCSNSCPFSRWCHPTISSSVVPFSCPQPFPASGSIPMARVLELQLQHQSFQWIFRVYFP